jgi:Family of unknown function (DUF5681)
MNTNDDAPGGYGRPPKSTRFKPGHSGNAKGRPKGGRNLKTDLASILQKRVAIREDGELRQVTRQEAMLLTLCAKALQGDTKASSQLFAMLTKTESQDTATSQPDVVTDNDCAIVEDFLRRNSVPVKK